MTHTPRLIKWIYFPFFPKNSSFKKEKGKKKNERTKERRIRKDWKQRFLHIILWSRASCLAWKCQVKLAVGNHTRNSFKVFWQHGDSSYGVTRHRFVSDKVRPSRDERIGKEEKGGRERERESSVSLYIPVALTSYNLFQTCRENNSVP